MSIQELCQWGSLNSQGDGVIVGCAQNQEYLLPWWWSNYQKHNSFPVTFFDFGDMSLEAKTWCRQRGQLLTIPSVESFIVPKELIASDKVKSWELHLDLDPWKARLEWFKKPLACLKSPYKRTIWFDLDCQIFHSIAPIFDECEKIGHLALAEEPPMIRYFHENEGVLQAGQMEYNTGVIVFKHGISLIQDWARKCLESNKQYRGDQEVFAYLVYEKQFEVNAMPPRYNWRGDMIPNEGFMEFLVVIHWLGECKAVIKHQIAQLTQ